MLALTLWHTGTFITHMCLKNDHLEQISQDMPVCYLLQVNITQFECMWDCLT